MNRSHFAGVFDFFPSGVGFCDTQVILYRFFKQIGALRNHGYVFKQRICVDFIDIYIVVVDFAAASLPKSHQKFQKSGFAAAAFAHDTYNLALFGVHFDIFQHLGLSVVTERKIFYVEFFVIEIFTAFNRFHRRFFREKIKHSVAACESLRKVAGKRTDRDYRTERREHRYHTDNHSA